ncbi:MAG: heterodisulfide reductase-related iron-sulfur binding cluster [Acidimicrobiia bacterium]|nr:heterodisulfide reductase-related iron-sulfur binding cluster [Acidimicrobiia bacterium]
MLTIATTEGREVFEGFASYAVGLFYVLATLAIGVFIYGFWRRFQKYRGGASGRRLTLRQIGRAAADLASQRTVAKRDPYVGVAHFLVFWGFIVLLIGTTIIAIDEDIIGLLLGKPEWQFWHGAFYVIYALLLDLFGIGFIVGLLMLAGRRRSEPFKLDYTRVDLESGAYDRSGYSRDDRVFLSVLLLLGVTGFLLEGFRIAANDFPSFERVAFSGWLVGLVTQVLGEQGNDIARLVTWWLHSVAALGFVAYIPFSKAMHVIVDGAALALTDQNSARSLAPVADMSAPGYSSLSSFTKKELLDQDACTKCGRCHDVCPARGSGSPLSPRDLILDLREFADASSRIRMWYGPGAQPQKAEETEVAGGVIASDVLWGCTTCMACMDVCPVGIEHVPTIVQLRRRLVDLGDVEPGLQTAFQSLARGGNSFGKSAKQRARWTKGLEFTVKDIREEPAEYLWFVGDHAAYDPRAADVTRIVAGLLERAGVDFGIMYDGERNSGNDVRRAGEEGLFEMLRDHNREMLAAATYQRIFTTDPHSLNTLRNEYDMTTPVLHYTELLAQLAETGVLAIGGLDGRATYHDPCYLGRYAAEYDAPRRLIEATGLELVEMPRSREDSYCCGAGGGRIWMDDSTLDERPSESRIREAVALGADVRFFVVSCPKDMIMYSDAVKTTAHEGQLEVVDIAQLLERAVDTEAATVG